MKYYKREENGNIQTASEIFGPGWKLDQTTIGESHDGWIAFETDEEAYTYFAQDLNNSEFPPYETSTGIKLATQEQDQTAFTRMLALIDLTQMDPSEMVIIKDAAGEQHGVTVEQFKDLMKEYGAHCYSLHVSS